MIDNICIGVFIHNEQEHIQLFLEDLVTQSIFHRENIHNTEVYLLCNGCTDDSVKIATEFSELHDFNVINWPLGGKSLTWNRFVHEIVPENTSTIVFTDGDLRLPEKQSIEKLVTNLNLNSSFVTTSKPVKDLTIYSHFNPLRYIASVIKMKHRDGSICGQLYAMNCRFAKQIWLPTTCLVEDGFLAAITATLFFSENPNTNHTKAVSGAWHLFEPPQNISEFFQHDVRLALGTELNAALYTKLWATQNITEAQNLLKNLSKSTIEIKDAIDEHLKRPENQALQFKRVLHYLWPKGQSYTKGFILFPVRVAHMIYMIFVFKSARSLFRTQKFKW